MKRTIDAKLFRDLVRLFGGLHDLQDKLLQAVQSKIEAMKRADIQAMRQFAEREQALITRQQEREGFRCQLMDRIGGELGLPGGAGRSLSISQLASRLAEPQCTVLQDAAGKVRERALKVAQTNRVAGVVAREITNHLKWVFASVRPEGDSPVGYAGDGALVTASSTKILETVG